MSTLTERLAEVLAEHAYRESAAGRAAHCSCGTWLLGAAQMAHRTHIAAALEPVVLAMLAEAWEAAIHHVEPHLSGEIKRAAMKDNPYRASPPGPPCRHCGQPLPHEGTSWRESHACRLNEESRHG